jgi:hypothetical protein
MTATQERAVAAMRAIGDTVTGAPPLRLPPQTAAARSPRFTRLGRQTSRAWRLWLVPATAAVAVVAIAVSLAVVRSAPKEPQTLPGTETPGSATLGTGGSAGVPPYYVTLPAFGWTAYAPATAPTGSNNQTVLVVGETATGKRLATVPPPRGLAFNVVTGAADDRTFIVGATPTGMKTVSMLWPETWYLLRISPGTSHVARLTRLHVPAVDDVTGVALSPDGTELAVASKQFNVLGSSSANNPPRLSLWSVATGKELWHWATQSGWITASTPAAGSRPEPFDTDGMATALRWTPDGGALAYAWNGAEIRLLDLTAQGPGPDLDKDLVKASRLRASIGDYDTPAGASFTCVAADGWSLSTAAKTFTCAGRAVPMGAATGPGCGKAAPAHPALFQDIQLSGGASELTTLAQAPGCVPNGPRAKSASLGWSNADGSRVIAMLGDLTARDDRLGIFTKKTFTSIPAILSSGSLATVAW